MIPPPRPVRILPMGGVAGHVPMTVLALRGKPPPQEWSVFYVHHVLLAARVIPEGTGVEAGGAREVYGQIVRRGVPTGTIAHAVRAVLEALHAVVREEEVRDAAEMEAECDHTLCARGRARLCLGRTREAMRDFEEARREAPFEPGGHAGLGRACELMGDLEAAERHFTSALHLSNDLGRHRARKDLLRVLVLRDKREEALHELHDHIREVEALFRRGGADRYVLRLATEAAGIASDLAPEGAAAELKERAGRLADAITAALPKPSPDRLRPPSY